MCAMKARGYSCASTGFAQLSFSSSSNDEWLNVTAAIKLVNCLGQKELLDEVSGWFDDGSDVLDVYVPLERLRHGRMI
jgi:hypothetical protein